MPDTGEDLKMYWGTVVRIDDPEKLGRVRIHIPGLTHRETDWAYPVGQAGAGSERHGAFTVPRLGSTVLVGFVLGDFEEPFFLAGPHARTRSALEPTTVPPWPNPVISHRSVVAAPSNQDINIQIKVTSSYSIRSATLSYGPDMTIVGGGGYDLTSVAMTYSGGAVEYKEYNGTIPAAAVTIDGGLVYMVAAVDIHGNLTSSGTAKNPLKVKIADEVGEYKQGSMPGSPRKVREQLVDEAPYVTVIHETEHFEIYITETNREKRVVIQTLGGKTMIELDATDGSIVMKAERYLQISAPVIDIDGRHVQICKRPVSKLGLDI